MVTLRRIGVFSASRVGFIFGVATSIVNIAFALFMLIVVQGVPISVLTPEVWLIITINVLLSSCIVGLGVGMFAFLYNLNPSIGGLKLEFDMQDGSVTKRKNDEFIDIDEEEID